jgi:hypothetical protein
MANPSLSTQRLTSYRLLSQPIKKAAVASYVSEIEGDAFFIGFK